MLRANASKLVAIVLSMSYGAASAGGAVAGATEITQILNNLQLVQVAMDGATTAQKTAQQYITQVQQYETQLQNIRGLPGLPAGMGGDAMKAVNDMVRFKQALANLTGSLGQQSRIMQQRMAEARVGGKGWDSYVQQVSADAASGSKRAIERLNYEESVLQQVQSDYQFARNLQDQIPATVGQHQALQLLNAQMNRVVTQNAKMLEVMSGTISKQAQDEQKQAEAKARALADQELMRQRHQNIEQRQRAFGGLPQ